MWMSMRSIFAAEASCSTGSTLLHLLHHIVGAIPLQLFLDLDSDGTNGVVLQRDRNRHVLQLPSGRRGQHRQLSPECQRHVGEGRTPFGLQQTEARPPRERAERLQRRARHHAQDPEPGGTRLHGGC